MTTETQALATLSKARELLAKAGTVDEVREIRDQAEAMRAYSKQRKYSLDCENYCAEIKLRAERKLGDLLSQIERAKTGPKKLNANVASNYANALTDIDAAPRTAQRWQAIATIPEKDFDSFVEEIKAKQEELTSLGAYKLARQLNNNHHSRKAKEKPLFDEDVAANMLYEKCNQWLEKYWPKGYSLQPVYMMLQNLANQLKAEEKRRKGK